MDMIPSNGSRTTSMEKLIRYGVPLAIAGVAFYFWGTISGFVAETMKNTLKTLLYGIPAAFIVGALVLYPTFWWMQYKILCKKITGFFINLDPLSFMDRYVDILSEKLTNLNSVKVQLEGKKTKTKRRLDELAKNKVDALKLGAAALKQNNQSQASLNGQRAAGAQQSTDLLTPGYNRLCKSLEFMNALSENWAVSIIGLREEIDRKRQEYEIVKANASGLKEAEAFLNGDTEEGKIYQQSLKALEENVTQRIAYIEDFEKRAKGTMEGIQVDNQMHKDEGLAMLEQYMKDGKLLLPDSYADSALNQLPKFKDTSKIAANAEQVGGPFDLLK